MTLFSSVSVLRVHTLFRSIENLQSWLVILDFQRLKYVVTRLAVKKTTLYVESMSDFDLLIPIIFPVCLSLFTFYEIGWLRFETKQDSDFPLHCSRYRACHAHVSAVLERKSLRAT